MMQLWVADASVACKRHFDEESASHARALLHAGRTDMAKTPKIYAPSCSDVKFIFHNGRN